MVADTKAYCETCHTCKISKPSNQKPYGLLNPPSLPTYPWESIGMDFVGPLPESGNRDGIFDSITVDLLAQVRLRKYVYFSKDKLLLHTHTTQYQLKTRL